jgi:two-component system cell cycle response regulator
MVRFTRRVFADLAIYMIGFGLLIGIVFPPFVALLGVPTQYVLTPWFFAICMAAGFLVGAVNIGLGRMVVGRRLCLLADRMRTVEANWRELARRGEMAECTPEACQIAVDSEDEIGESAEAFNRLVEALALAHQTQSAVRKFSNVLGSQLELPLLAGQALEQLFEHTGASAGAILIDQETDLHPLVSHGVSSPERLAASDHVRRALATEKRQRVSLPDDVTVDGILTQFRPRDVVVEPILYKHVPLGVIVLAASGEFSELALSRLELFGQGLGLALNNALTHDRLQRLAALDPLTSIYNRRFGLARLQEEFSRAVRATAPLGLLMLDIDGFKSVNDTYGHLVGDRFLVHVAKIARSVLREGDVLVRYGGDELMAILPAASKQDVGLIGERLRRVVEEAPLQDGEQLIRVTVSLGGTAYPEFDADSRDELVRNADSALYAAKEAGRNCAKVA